MNRDLTSKSAPSYTLCCLVCEGKEHDLIIKQNVIELSDNINQVNVYFPKQKVIKR